MDQKDNSGKFWPYFILGFLAIGITLGYWTIKNTISMPVKESETFMTKYQNADKNYNKYQEAELNFDKSYTISFSGLAKSSFKPKHLKRKPHQYYTLEANSTLVLQVLTKDSKAVNDANVTLLFTSPVTNVYDKYFKNIKSQGEGKYILTNITPPKPGRYILRVNVKINENTQKFIDIYCWAPKK